jgi:D-arabinose 5-phosphate isomerase GutQ
MKQLKCFNTVKVFDGHDIKEGDFERLKFGGYLTVSQSGKSDHLVKAIELAKKHDITCINVVNVEDSPIT